MCINVDKVSKKTGSDQIVCCHFFSDCLTTSFKMWPRAYAFPKKYDGQSRQVNSTKPMGDREMPGFLSKIKNPILGAWDYGKPMHQGVQLLRSSYVTWFYNRGTFYGDDGPIPDHNAKKALAKSMRHQWQQAKTNYRKLPVVQQRTAVWDDTIKAYRVEEGNRVIDHIGDPNLIMNPIPDDLKPTKPPEPPIYQPGAGSPIRGAVEGIPVDMEWVNEYMPKKMAGDITMATRGANDRHRFQTNYQQIRSRQVSERNRAYHQRNKAKIIAKRLLRRIALRGNADFMTDGTREKYAIRTDAAGEFYSGLLNRSPSQESQRQEPLSDVEEEETDDHSNSDDVLRASDPQQVKDRRIRKAMQDAEPRTQWQRRFRAEWENDPYKTIIHYLPVTAGDVTERDALDYRSKVIHLHNVLVAYG